MTHKTQVEYKVGDILLAEIPYLKECEIQEIAVEAKCLKIDGSWFSAADVTPKIKAVLGRVAYRKSGLFGWKTERYIEYV